MDDGWETQHFGDLSRNGTGDFESDGMTDLEEFLHAFDPTAKDAFDDADGDRYPNIFELRSGGDPNDSSRLPTPRYVVNPAGGGTHTTVNAAVTAANVADGAYQIIALAPGTYSGSGNINFSVASTKPKLLFIGTEGAAKTIIDGGGTNYGWTLNNSAILASLTFQRTTRALYVSASGQEVRLVDLLVKDNTTNSTTSGLQVASVGKLAIVHSTFLNNTTSSTSTASAQQMYLASAAVSLTNTVVWGTSSRNMVYLASGAQLTASYSLVKGQTLSGTGNLDVATDPMLRSDGRQLWGSPLAHAGAAGPHSRLDMDLEQRPSTSPDIGADAWGDADADELADVWEVQQAGNLTTLTGRAQDADSDGLSNEQEYALYTKATVADSDGDGLSDSAEVNQHGTDPLKADTDGDDMPDGWEWANGLSLLTNDRFQDADGDRYPNVFEYAGGTNPQDAQSVPTPRYVVNPAGGGTHTTVNAAVTAANVADGAYQIIALAPGTYSGSGNINFSVAATKPKLLFIGTEGAAKTVIDGGGTNVGWTLNNSAVLASLTFQRTTRALYVSASGQEVRLVDLLVKDNASTGTTGGLEVPSVGTLSIIHSTFVNNTTSSTSTSAAQQVYLASTAATFTNTVVWGTSTRSMVYVASNAQLTASNSLVKGLTLTGTGNLAGATDPLLRSDGRQLWGSPLARAGTTGPHSRLDMDLELRPTSAPDIGADLWVDADADELADVWEVQQTGALTTLSGRTQDADGDGLSNAQEYALYTQATVADTDGDGLLDGAEVNQHGTDPLKADTDGDDMPDGWEWNNGLALLTPDRFEDADGDRYPNVFEYAGGTNPQDAQSIPTPRYVVNPAGGGTHTTVNAAVTAANVADGAYQIIALAPGTYSGSGNINFSVAATKPKLLFIGTEGAAKTVIDGGGTNSGWVLYNTAVVASLTFQRTTRALYVNAPGHEVLLSDLLVKDNASTGTTGGLEVPGVGKLAIIHSTFLNNTTSSTSTSAAQQMYLASAAVSLTNTVVWGNSTQSMVYVASNAQLTASYSLVKGRTLSGAGNLASTTDPKLRSDGRQLWASPLLHAGTAGRHSRLDMDLELRPSSAPDIGADAWTDTDADELADVWEMQQAGNLTTLTGRAQDADSDGLSNEQEYALYTKATVADSDGDGLSDSAEVNQHGTDPLKADTDGDDMPDGWEWNNGLSLLTNDRFQDADGDRYPNVFEYAGGTNPQDAQSVPTPRYVVNPAGGGTHTTVNAAVTAANVADGAYQIIALAPGTYSGSGNVNFSVAATKPKLLFIGTEGAAKTVIDGGGTNVGWTLNTSAVIASLTFQRTTRAFYVSASGQEVLLSDLLVKDNATNSTTGGLQVASVGTLSIVHSTFLNNTTSSTSASSAQQMYLASAAVSLTNTVVWGESTQSMVYLASGAQLTARYSLVKGLTLTGTGNLAGSTDPKLRSDGRQLWGSPLAHAGTTGPHSRLDMDLEQRPSTSPDIGADAWVDADADELADSWEVQQTGTLTTLTGRAQDADSDGLSNEQEYALYTQATVADTDGDGLLDSAEVNQHGTDPLKADTDGDDMPDGWEWNNGLALLTNDRFQDADGDRYPNVFEYAGGTNPQDAQSVPTPRYVVNPAGGGTHTTVNAAVTAANVADGAYQIIALAPGTYSGSGNVNFSVASTKPKLLFIGTEGAAKTVIDGGGTNVGWTLNTSAVIASLTFQRTTRALYVSASGQEVLLSDLLVKDNATNSTTGGLQVASLGTLSIIHSTFLNNTTSSTSTSTAQQLYLASAAVSLTNTVVWGESTRNMTYVASGAQLTASNSLVKGQTLSGTGNLDGSTDPKLRSDGRIRSTSPLRGAGVVVPASSFDMDVEPRPSTSSDIGADQWTDVDADGAADAWETAQTGDLATLGGGDADSDLLSDADEYDWETDPFQPDTDGDLVTDGDEVAAGMDPLMPDSENLVTDANQDGILDGLGLQLGISFRDLDVDDDSVPNADELRMGTDPLRADTDGDGAPDGQDAFPLDPLASALSHDSTDVTPPVITLTAPTTAVLL